MRKGNPNPTAEEPGAAELAVPPDLRAALATAPKAKAQWKDLTPIARRDFITWIASAKQDKTRATRIEKATSMLAAGKRRPCCYSIVSLDLHLALKATPQAKTQWSTLTPNERRDFIAWMDEPKEPAENKLRIQKACAQLAAGKRKPAGKSNGISNPCNP